MGSRCRGFTLLEILIVLFIIGIGWFSLLPSLDVSRGAPEDEAAKELNAFLDTVRNVAVTEYKTQKLSIKVGGSFILWGKESFSLPAAAARCVVNDLPPEGLDFSFRIYRDGIMDKVRLELMNGDALESDVLAVRFK
ncbi:MAG: type II secretion system protein [Desulfovibrionaceae bacterium]